ncbi:MAG: GNAT family N-acetyltransferase [Bacteroidia bacterium]
MITVAENYTLRSWKESDLESLVRYANNYNIAKNLTDKFPHPYTKEHGIAFIAMASGNFPLRIFAIEIDGEAAGGIGLHPQEDIYRRNMELGYWLAEKHWGKGIMPNAIREITDYGFRNFDIDRIFARPFGSNKASQRVLEKAGFHFETKFEKTLIKNGVLEDELFYAARRNQYPQS